MLFYLSASFARWTVIWPQHFPKLVKKGLMRMFSMLPQTVWTQCMLIRSSCTQGMINLERYRDNTWAHPTDNKQKFFQAPKKGGKTYWGGNLELPSQIQTILIYRKTFSISSSPVSLPHLSVTTVLPDVEAAEQSEEKPCCQWDRHRQEEGDEAVTPQPGHLKQGVTPQPHFIKAPHRRRLCNHILKRDLKTHTDTDFKRGFFPSISEM